MLVLLLLGAADHPQGRDIVRGGCSHGFHKGNPIRGPGPVIVGDCPPAEVGEVNPSEPSPGWGHHSMHGGEGVANLRRGPRKSGAEPPWLSGLLWG